MEDINQSNNQPANFGTEPAVPQQPAPQQPAPQPPQVPQQPVQAPTPGQQPGQTPAPAAVLQQPASQPPVAGQPKQIPQVPKKPGVKIPTKEEMIQKERERNKKVLIGCGGAFGCGTILLLVLIFVFVGTAGTGSSALAQALGVNQQQLINTLITIVNLFFGIGAFIAFILSIGGIFKALMARKDDKFAKNRGYMLAGSSFGILVVIIGLWIGAWYYLSSRQIPSEPEATGLVTIPEETINLTAPVEITFDASNLPYDKRNYDIISYFWDFGDGTSGPGTSVETHIYEKKGDGRYDVKLILTFVNKNSGEESTEPLEHTVTIGDEKVTAIIEADVTEGEAPLTVTFDGSGSMDPDGKISSYAWEIDGQGFEEGEETFEYTFDQLGTYKVSLRVTNQKGDYAIAEETIEVSGSNLPSAVIDILNDDGGKYYIDKNYTFDASNSKSPSGSITNYEWDFGDGTAKSRTRTAQHSFSEAGTYKVVLTVIDEENKASASEKVLEVDVSPSSPEAVMITNPKKADPADNFIAGVIPFEVDFDATSSSDPDDDIVDYKWDFNGDGAYDSVGETTSYVFSAPGSYSVSLVVVDSVGFESKKTLLVKAESPGLQAVVTAEPVSGVVPLTVNFDATGSTYSDGQIINYEWDFGDGSPRRSDIGQVTYQYTQIGNFTAKVKVRTNDNKEETADILISVRQVPLKACFEPSKIEGDAPLTVVFNASCSTGTIAKYRWDFGDGDTSTQHKPTHVFETPGSYEVVLEVADAQNVIDTSSQFITVTGELTN